MSFVQIAKLVSKVINKKQLSSKINSAQICNTVNSYIVEKIEGNNTKAIMVKDKSIYLSSDSYLESQNVLLHSSDILIYLESKFPGVNELSLKITSKS